MSFANDIKHLRIIDDLTGKKILPGATAHRDDHNIKYPLVEGANSSTYKKKSVGLALFGLGRIGMIHFLNIVKTLDAKLLYCVEHDQQKLNYVSFKWDLTAKMVQPDQVDQVLADSNVDAVVICTPTYTHEELVLKSLNAGKAVLCEKPLTLSSDEIVQENSKDDSEKLDKNYEGIRRCYQLAEEVGKPLFCAFNRRFDPAFNEIKQRVDNGDIGQIHVVKTCARDSPKPTMDYIKTSGGIFHDCGVHDIDLICWIMGAYPIKVSAIAHSFDPEVADINDYDTVAITMKFPSGALGIIDLSRMANYGYDQRLEVFGPKGMLTSGDLRPTNVQHHSDNGSVKNPICYSFTSRYTDAYMSELEHFLTDVKENRKPVITAESVLNVSRIATAVEKAAREGKVVDISWN